MPANPSLLQRAETLDLLAPDPRGKYFVGRTWLSFYAAHGRLSGTIAWGEPSADDVKEWSACADLRLSPGCIPHATLFDGYKIERFSPNFFAALERYAAKSLGELQASITRVAVLHSGRFAAAVATGFAKLVPLPFPLEVFTDPTAALGWLGCAEDGRLLEELGRAQTEARTVAPLVRELAAFLRQHPRSTPSEAARALALSTRSLQRRLSEQKTTFRNELDDARVWLAQRLLSDSDASITAVALQVGFNSPQHLSTLFRRLGHESPSEWRARARASRA